MTEKDFLALVQVAHCSQSISRYSRDTLIRPESVLAHVGFVAMFSMWSCQRLNLLNVSIDAGQVALCAVFHDLDEIVTGDIPRTTKYATTELRSQLGNIADKSVHRLDDTLDMKGLLYNAWQDAKDISTLEGMVVSLADLAAVLYKIYDELVLGHNLAFRRVLLEYPKAIQACRKRAGAGWEKLRDGITNPEHLRELDRAARWFDDAYNTLFALTMRIIRELDHDRPWPNLVNGLETLSLTPQQESNGGKQS